MTHFLKMGRGGALRAIWFVNMGTGRQKSVKYVAHMGHFGNIGTLRSKSPSYLTTFRRNYVHSVAQIPVY